MEIHGIPGHGFSEIVYKDAMMVEAKFKEIPFKREKEFKIEYKKPYFNIPFFPDFFLMKQL